MAHVLQALEPIHPNGCLKFAAWLLQDETNQL
jgi:hypothetical protein